MSAEKVYFRDSELQINEGTHAAPSWTAIGHKKSLTYTPEAGETDLYDWESDGWSEHVIMKRGGTWTLTCHRMEDTYDGTRDAGQEAVETLAEAVGNDSIGEFQLTTPGTETWTFYASAKVTPFAGSGGSDDAIEWVAELKMTGRPTVA